MFAVWNVFQSPGLDFRMIVVGALLPTGTGVFFGEQSYGHTLIFSVTVLVVVMLATAGRGKRLTRRRILGIPIGMLYGLVLAGTWRYGEVLWWPFRGTDFPGAPLVAPWPVVGLQEAAGVAAGWWAWRRFGLADTNRRRVLWRTGRLEVVSS